MVKLNQAGRTARIAFGLAVALVVLDCAPRLGANVIFVAGNLRSNATVTDCGAGCTLGPLNSDGDYAQWAAVVTSFTVSTTTTMQAITYGYGGGTSLTGAVVPAGGLEPYLSLFDSGGNFLASTYFGTTCPPGANAVGGNCFDVLLDGGTLSPGVYAIALTAWENMSVAENSGGHLSDGFTGLGNLAATENLNYAYDIILPANVPEPASIGLALIGCGVFLVWRRISRRAAWARRRRPIF